MRQKRAKAYRKLMHLYSMSFGFRQPYQVLVDSEMCKVATAHKLDLVKQLGSVLQGEVKPMITQCCIHELYLQGKEQQPAVDLAKLFERRKCNHREPIPGDDCLIGVVGDKNKHRYVIATQSQPLRVKLRSIPATPLIHINRSVMVLEPPSDATLKAKEATEEKALHAPPSDIALVGTSNPEDHQPKKQKGPKGPNPLSVKRKKPLSDEPTPKQKSKGKEVSTVSGMKTAAGAKRKRSEPADESGEDNIRIQHIVETDAGESDAVKKRRKRRRKAKTEGDRSDEVTLV
ncbi:Fcf1-domain-containing protein [Crucibulum laeve]|uniref:U three protein 23 n=1 Tax=Crucibulum laeve TaxID=68775 RepID=A0A5C3MB26_9AGAR|nr:Fcf1-domain-containing protein [Crucibulum laeve]